MLAIAFSSGGCRSRRRDTVRPVTSGEGKSDAAAAVTSLPKDLTFCKPTENLSHGALTVEQQREDNVSRLSVDSRGKVLRNDRVVGSVSGGCLWKGDVNAVAGIDPRGNIVMANGTRVGTVIPRTFLSVDGEDVRVGEVLVLADADVEAISSAGSVYLVPRDRPPFSLPAMIGGDVVGGRRTAFMLLQVGRDLD